MDVKREADKVREARKRIRLDPSVLTPEEDLNGFGGMSMGLNLRERERSLLATALPSVCAYTFHDSQDG
jgi:transcription initiation factor TFIID subunit 5